MNRPLRLALSLLFVAAGSLALVGCGDSDAGGATRIAVIPKGTTHEFWKAIEKGARGAAEELGVEMIWKGPIQEDDRASQIKVVQQFVTQRVDGIALAPMDNVGLARPVAAARKAGIPVVVYDSGLDGTPGQDYEAYVATDNLEGGRIAGRKLAELLGGSGKVVMLRYQAGSASTALREQGFLEAIGANSGIEVLSSDQYAGATIGEAKTKASNLMNVLREADGVFCPNESVTVGMLGALRQEGLLEAVQFVGFDSSETLATALEAGQIEALVLQDPVDMGARAVRTLVAAIRGESYEVEVDTAIAVATPENHAEPDIARLLR